MSRNERGWRAWFDKDAPEEAQTPDGYHISFDSFRKLLLIRWATDVSQCRIYYDIKETKSDTGLKSVAFNIP